jgi:hypothetical protein
MMSKLIISSEILIYSYIKKVQALQIFVTEDSCGL